LGKSEVTKLTAATEQYKGRVQPEDITRIETAYNKYFQLGGTQQQKEEALTELQSAVQVLWTQVVYSAETAINFMVRLTGSLGSSPTAGSLGSSPTANCVIFSHICSGRS
jgi:hypothetical protein